MLVNVEIAQLSEALGAVQVPMAMHEALAESEILVGHPVITGLVLSETITLNVQVEVLPDASVAV